MSYLIVSILLTTSLFIYLRFLDIQKIQISSSLIGNYITCIVLGLLLLHPNSSNASIHFNSVYYYCLLLGILFFIIFYLMSYSSGKIGVGITGAATKISFVIPAILSALILNQSLGLWQIISCIIAIFAIGFMLESKKNNVDGSLYLIPFIIWLGSGAIDFILGYLKNHLNSQGLNQELSIVFIFTGACLSALLYLKLKKEKLFFKHFAYGIPLGIANYFSIHFLMLALGSGYFTYTELYLINNIAIVLLTFVLGLILFKEVFNLKKGIGLALCLLSIITMILMK
jgi:drug/metabolite transporter (DMT)-like permease